MCIFDNINLYCTTNLTKNYILKILKKTFFDDVARKPAQITIENSGSEIGC